LLTAYGVLSLTFMMAMYALERRGPRFILLFALGCLLSSIYGSLPARGRSGSSKRSGARSPWRATSA